MKISCILFLFYFVGNVVAQAAMFPKDSLQNIFMAGKIVSLNGDVACYRKNGIQNRGSYGYCIYDGTYEPKVSSVGKTWTKEKGEVKTILNSKCYTIIPPVFDYALSFSDGWGAVCKDNKWSYVSREGVLMCDFVLDAAYPFREGHAKIIYKGKQYDIDKYGQGMPLDINTDTHIISRKYQALTVEQLYEENQFEKAIEKGNLLYKDVLCHSGKILYDVTSNELAYAIQAEHAAVSSKNSIMSLLLKSPNLFDYYQSNKLEYRFTVESGKYELNDYNSEYYFKLLNEKYLSDSLVCQIVNNIEEKDYKSAISLFERWINMIDISIEDCPLELMTYFYLAELSNSFETANNLLFQIANLYENHRFDWLQDNYLKGSLLLNIRRYQSAESHFKIAINEAKKQNDILKEAICNYNMAILYGITKNINQGLIYYQHSWDIFQREGYIFPSGIKNDFMSSFLDFLLSNNLWTDRFYSLFDCYVKSEIDYNVELLISSDILHANRFWGRSLSRFQKVLQHLDYCKNDYYLKNAFILSVFQQSITFDSETLFLAAIRNTDDENIKSLTEQYFQLKKEYKGFDLFDVGDSNLLNKENALKINQLEQTIRSLLIDNGQLQVKDDYTSLLNNLKEDDVIIDVVEYTVNSIIRKYGVFLARGLNDIVFIPLGKEDRFEAKEFWPTILKSFDLNLGKNYFLFAGKLDNLGLEYEKINNNDIAYLKLQLHRVNSLTNWNLSNQSHSLKSIALYGGLDYGEELIARNRGAIENGFLEYSKKEVDAISEIMANEMYVDSYSFETGTVKSFLNYDGHSPDIIHLATHGYQKDLNVLEWSSFDGFRNRDRFNYYRQNTDVENMELLMNNTGLYLSFSEKDTTNVLYSRAVASCDLSDTKLVVLSACSTLSGKKSDNYTSTISLTTAFTFAQVQNIITSLHKVDDQKTYEFMMKFYNKLKETSDIYNSFKETVAEMKSLYPDNKEFWGAFILLENYRYRIGNDI